MNDQADDATAEGRAERDATIAARIIELLRNEIQDRDAVLTRETTREQVAIDSIDIVNLVFAVETEFATTVDLPLDTRFDTVGDLVDALMVFVGDR